MPAGNGYNNTITISEPLSLPSIPAEARHEDTKEKWRPVIRRMAAKYRWLEERVGRVFAMARARDVDGNLSITWVVAVVAVMVWGATVISTLTCCFQLLKNHPTPPNKQNKTRMEAHRLM